MVNSMVERACSEMLIGPDWAMNIEICDICNHDPAQAKDVVKGIKKRVGSRNAKVQLLALTLLETLVKNCGDIVHMHVAERDLLHEMVKIVKKKPDFHVKEKILILIDTWQEAFGGPRARYPQYYAAYQELLRVGAVFPQRSESSAPVFTPPQTHPLSSYPQNLSNTESGPEVAESSAEAEFPTLSSIEIQNARGIMDVLAEMLNALDPSNKEAVKQEVIVDLVGQCRMFKQRLVHLVNSTSDELLLRQGLALNDDLQRVLAKHEAFSSGTPIPLDKPKSESPGALVDVGAPLIDTGATKEQAPSSSSGLGTLLALPAPSTNVPSSTAAKSGPMIDLLSGDDFSLPKAEDVLALVPAGETQPVSSGPSQQNELALLDMFTQDINTPATYSVGQSHPSSAQLQQQQNLQSPQQSLYPNGSVPGASLTQNGQAVYTQGSTTAWNGQILHQQQQPPSPVYGVDNSDSLPPPPWEVQADEPVQSVHVGQAVSHSQPLSTSAPYLYGSQPTVNHQAGGMYMQPVPGTMQGNQPTSMHPHGMMPGGQSMGMYPQPMQSGQMAYMYPQQMYGNQMMGYGGYGYGQQPNAQFIDQRMSGLSVRDDSGMGSSSYSVPMPSYVPSGKPNKPEDKLFGDLVDISKFKNKATPGRAGSM